MVNKLQKMRNNAILFKQNLNIQLAFRCINVIFFSLLNYKVKI